MAALIKLTGAGLLRLLKSYSWSSPAPGAFVKQRAERAPIGITWMRLVPETVGQSCRRGAYAAAAD
jgi:hypothetical protein